MAISPRPYPLPLHFPRPQKSQNQGIQLPMKTTPIRAYFLGKYMHFALGPATYQEWPLLVFFILFFPVI